MTSPAAESHEQQTLWSLIRDIRFAMLTTVDDQSRLHSRPMTTQNRRDDDGDRLWFFTSNDGEVAADVQRDDRVNVSYGDPDDDRYVSVSGRAVFIDDMAKKKALWSTMTQAWFPGGPEDPNVGLLEVRIEHAEYWDVKSNKMVQLAKMAAAAVRGTPPKMGEHADVEPRA